MYPKSGFTSVHFRIKDIRFSCVYPKRPLWEASGELCSELVSLLAGVPSSWWALVLEVPWDTQVLLQTRWHSLCLSSHCPTHTLPGCGDLTSCAGCSTGEGLHWAPCLGEANFAFLLPPGETRRSFSHRMWRCRGSTPPAGCCVPAGASHPNATFFPSYPAAGGD